MEISNLSELRPYLNRTVPLALRSHVSPPEFFQRQGYNVTSQQSELLKLLLRESSSHVQGGRQTRSVSSHSSCPVTWVIDHKSTRYPTMYKKAVCNGLGTTCTSATSKRPVCDEITVGYSVIIFLGISPNLNKLVWQVKTEYVPIGCTCSGVWTIYPWYSLLEEHCNITKYLVCKDRKKLTYCILYRNLLYVKYL